MSRPHIDDAQRRTRLGRRHGLAQNVDSIAAAVDAVVCLHATEPASVYLAAWARSGASRAQIDRALYDDRSVVRNLAMRRTVFGFPRDLLPAAYGSASARVAGQQRKRLVADAADAGVPDAEGWVAEQLGRVRELLHEYGPLTMQRIRELVPELDLRVTRGRGTRYQADVPLARGVVVTLDAQGTITRGRNTVGWKTSKPEWALTADWLGVDVAPLDTRAGYAELVRRWLARFGPGTEADLVWWLGATKGAVRRALADVEAVEVDLDGGDIGYVLPDDVDGVESPGPWAALLPALDPSVMGWKRRDFYLGDHAERLFDRNGNGGPTAWWDGRIVGGWRQHGDGDVVVVPAEPLPAAATRALDTEAERLTEWLAGDVVRSIYQSPLVRSSSST